MQIFTVKNLLAEFRWETNTTKVLYELYKNAYLPFFCQVTLQACLTNLEEEQGLLENWFVKDIVTCFWSNISSSIGDNLILHFTLTYILGT